MMAFSENVFFFFVDEYFSRRLKKLERLALIKANFITPVVFLPKDNRS